MARTASALLILAAPFSWIAGYHRRALYLVLMGAIVYLVLGRRHGPSPGPG